VHAAVRPSCTLIPPWEILRAIERSPDEGVCLLGNTPYLTVRRDEIGIRVDRQAPARACDGAH
jgi:hypothetical protein